MVRKLADGFIHLEVASGYVQWDVWAVDHSSKDHEIIWNDVCAVVGHKYAIAIELDAGFA